MCRQNSVCVCACPWFGHDTLKQNISTRARRYSVKGMRNAHFHSISQFYSFFSWCFTRAITRPVNTHTHKRHTSIWHWHILHTLSKEPQHPPRSPLISRLLLHKSLPPAPPLHTDKPKAFHLRKKKKYEPRNSHCCCPVRTPNWKTPQRKSADASLCWKA